MANFARIRSLGFWTFNSVWLASEAEAADVIRPKLANFSDGSTHAPSGFVIVGGAGFQLDGTGHEIATTGRLTVQAGGEIRLADTASAVTLPMLRIAGSAGDIQLYVKSHISTLEVKSGAVAKVDAGGALDMFGSLSLKTTGPGSITAETGTTSTWSSGSTLTINGTENINGILAVKSGGSLNVENAGFMTVQSGGTLTLGATAVIQTVAGCTVAGSGLTFQAKLIHDGAGGRTIHRATYNLDANASEDITVEHDVYRVALTLGSSSIDYPVRHTGVVPTAGERIYVVRSGPSTPGAQTAYIKREDGTVIFTFANSRQGFVLLEFDGTNWTILAANSVTTGTSGWFDDTW